MVFHNQKSFGDGIFSDYNNNHCSKTLRKKIQINKQTKLSKEKPERQNKEKPQDENETKFHSSIYKHRQNKKNNKSSEKR